MDRRSERGLLLPRGRTLRQDSSGTHRQPARRTAGPVRARIAQGMRLKLVPGKIPRYLPSFPQCEQLTTKFPRSAIGVENTRGDAHVPQSRDKGFTTVGDLPNPDLNPLLNPTLSRNLGRWAEVYFTTPPERREEAVEKLLRELEGAPARAATQALEPVATQQPPLPGGASSGLRANLFAVRAGIRNSPAILWHVRDATAGRDRATRNAVCGRALVFSRRPRDGALAARVQPRLDGCSGGHRDDRIVAGTPPSCRRNSLASGPVRASSGPSFPGLLLSAALVCRNCGDGGGGSPVLRRVESQQARFACDAVETCSPTGSESRAGTPTDSHGRAGSGGTRA